MEQPPRFVHSNKFIRSKEQLYLNRRFFERIINKKQVLHHVRNKKEEKRSDETRNEIDNRGVTLAAW